MSKSLSEEIHFALCCISECCVDESKRNITSRKAVEKIRKYLSVITDDDRYSKNFNISLKREILQKDQRIAELECDLENLIAYDLKKSHEYSIKILMQANENLSKQIAELKTENNEFCDYNKKLREEKQTAVKEFAEALKKRQYFFCNGQTAVDHFNEELEEMLKERGIE